MSSHRTQYTPQIGLGGPITPGVKMLIIANVAIFIVQVLALRFGRFHFEGLLGLTPEAVLKSGAVWQLGTYMFLHSTEWLGHVLLNMLMLWMFGTELERVWRTRAFLKFYFVCGVGSGLITCLFNYPLYPTIPTIGASGAIFGLMVAYAMLFPNRQIFFWYIFPMRATSFVLLCLGLEMFSLLNLSDGVAHFAHLGGALSGWLYLKRSWKVREMWREIRWRFKRRRFRVMRRDKDRYPFH